MVDGKIQRSLTAEDSDDDDDDDDGMGGSSSKKRASTDDSKRDREEIFAERLRRDGIDVDSDTISETKTDGTSMFDRTLERKKHKNQDDAAADDDVDDNGSNDKHEKLESFSMHGYWGQDGRFVDEADNDGGDDGDDDDDPNRDPWLDQMNDYKAKQNAESLLTHAIQVTDSTVVPPLSHGSHGPHSDVPNDPLRLRMQIVKFVERGETVQQAIQRLGRTAASSSIDDTDDSKLHTLSSARGNLKKKGGSKYGKAAKEARRLERQQRVEMQRKAREAGMTLSEYQAANKPMSMITEPANCSSAAAAVEAKAKTNTKTNTKTDEKLERLMSLADALMGAGVLNIYQQTQRKLRFDIDKIEDEREEERLRQRESAKKEAEARAAAASVSVSVSASASASASAPVWEYKWTMDDPEVHGPFTGPQMMQWRKYFKSAFVRRLRPHPTSWLQGSTTMNFI
jgi:hypothetical protein